MSQQIPKLLFVGAGNIAQSVINGVIRAKPRAAEQILVTAPSTKNLEILRTKHNCKTTLLSNAENCIEMFKPDFIFLCMKPQVLFASLSERDPAEGNMLVRLLNSIPPDCITISLLAGVKSELFSETFNIPEQNIVRAMLNTAAEVGSTSVLYYAHSKIDATRVKTMESLFSLISQVVVRLHDENLVNVGTGICGSGIAFFYEMIQTFSDVGVKNGLTRSDATMIAAQLSKSAGEMLLTKRSHPYQLRDEVASPAGTTIYGLDAWHAHSTSQNIGRAIQASIDRATQLSAACQLNK